MSYLPNIPMLLAAGLTASVILAPVRLGFFEVVRPTILVMLPCLAGLFILEQRKVAQLLLGRLGFVAVLLGLLLTVGHLLGNDLATSEAEEDSTLSIEGIWVMIAVFIGGIIVAEPRYRSGVFVGLALGLVAHVVSLAMVPASIDFRGYARSSGMMKDPNILLIHIIPVYFAWLCLLPKGRWLMLAPVGLVAVYWSTLQTLSRGGLISMLVGTALCVVPPVLASRRKLCNFRFVAAAAVVLMLLAAVCVGSRGAITERLEAYQLRSQERMDTQESFLADRLIWLEDIQRIGVAGVLKPLGVGYDHFQSTDLLPHNTFVDVLVVAGPVALLLFCFLVGGVLWNASACLWRRSGAELPPLFDGACLAATASHFLMLVSLSVLPWKVNWLLLGLSIGLLRARYPTAVASDESEAEEMEPAIDPVIATDRI